VVRCESIFTLNQSMILRQLGTLGVATIERINACLIAALAL
jgi:mRNA interferase MazF